MGEECYKEKCTEFMKILKMKLWYLYGDDYETVLLDHCKYMIEKDEDVPHPFNKIIKGFCISLQDAILFKHNNENVTWRKRNHKKPSSTLEHLNDAIKNHLDHYCVQVKPYDDYHERFNMIIKYNCQALISLMKVKPGFLKTHNSVIKYACQALFEVIQWKIRFAHRPEYDNLIKAYSKTLLFALDEIMDQLNEEVLEIASKFNAEKLMHCELAKSLAAFGK